MPVGDYNWGGFKPWKHQETDFYRSRDRPFYAHLWEMRTGKTPVVIHTAAYLKSRGKINALLVISPNYLKGVWAEQFEEHAPDWLTYETRVWAPTKKNEEEIKEWKSEEGELVVLLMNEEALSTVRGAGVASRFLRNNTAMMVIDESTSIANHKTKRSKMVHTMKDLAPYRRILTGTPTTGSPLDLWSQFYFLDPGILGFSNFYAFRNRYATLGGFKGKEVIGYVDLDVIQSRIERHSSRVLRSDVKDVPPKLYQTATVALTTQQQRIYDRLKKEMLATWESMDREQRRLEVRSILAQMVRLQQVVGGFLPSEAEPDERRPNRPWRDPEPIPGGNPKLDVLLGYLEVLEPGGKAVIFSRFRAEIRAIEAAISETFGSESVVTFYGDVSPAEKEAARRAFTDPDSPVRFFVANQRSARMGLDLSIASLVLYFSNSFSYLDRVQSEDRTETIVKDSESTMYIDIMASAGIDRTIRRSLREKRKISDVITGDEPLSEWI